MAKKHGKKKGKKMSTNEKPKTKNSQFFGHEIIRVKKAKFVDGQTIGAYLKAGGTRGTLRAAVKSGSVEIEEPEEG